LNDLRDWSVEALPPGSEDAEETGATFLENATLKAQHYSRGVEALTIADDSGLCVEALGDRPGVLSARYGPTPEARNRRLLDELQAAGAGADRSARFFCALALAQSGVIVWTAEMFIRGRIPERASGAAGFGYDPVFWIPELGKTMAELTTDEKNRVSARGRALAELRRYLEQIRT
jgi:XTP/dITP diphosphohydrolase